MFEFFIVETPNSFKMERPLSILVQSIITTDGFDSDQIGARWSSVYADEST